jgi:hypothetical protein
MATEFDHLAGPPVDREFKAGDRIRMVADIVTPRSSRALGEVNVLGREGVIVETRNDGHLPYVVEVEGKGRFPVARPWIEAA